MRITKLIFPYLTSLLVISCLSKREGITNDSGTIFQEGTNSAVPDESYEEMVITMPPASKDFDPFYKKYIDAAGIPIIEQVPDQALLVARDIVNYMLLKRFDIRETLIDQGSRVLVMAESEMETDLPERSDWKKPTLDDKRLTPGEQENYDKPGGIASMTDQEYWNQRARGMGGTITSCAEENLLGYPGTRYYGEYILVHEFSHNIMRVYKKRIRNYMLK